MKSVVGIPSGAEFIEDWNEWGLGKRLGGKLEGHWKFWRPDGTFVEESDWIEGECHGRKVRFHDDGSFSEVADYVHGEMIKLVCHRTDNKTQETTHIFANISERIRKAEFRYSVGFQTAQRFWDIEGEEIDFNGNPVPTRTKGLPDTAFWSSGNKCWLDGKWRGRDSKRFGLWREWSAEGLIQQVTYYHEGKVLAALGKVRSQGNPLIEAQRYGDNIAVEHLLFLGLGASPGAAHHAAFEGMGELCQNILSWKGEILLRDPRPSFGDRPKPPPLNAVWVSAMESWLAGEIDPKTGEALGEWRQWRVPMGYSFVTCKTALFVDGILKNLHEYRDDFETLKLSTTYSSGKERLVCKYDSCGQLKEEVEQLDDGREVLREYFEGAELKRESFTSPDGSLESKCYFASGTKRGQYRVSADKELLEESWFDEDGMVVMKKALHMGKPLCEVFDETGKRIAWGNAKIDFGGMGLGEWEFIGQSSAQPALTDLKTLEVGIDEHARQLVAWLLEPVPDELVDCEEVAWEELETYFGSAKPFPFWLKGLSLGDEWVFGWSLSNLWDAIFHQGTVCEAGGPALKRIVGLFERIQREEHLAQLVDFVLRCATRDYSLEASLQMKRAAFGEEVQAFFAEDSPSAFEDIYQSIALALKSSVRFLRSEHSQLQIAGAMMLALSNRQEAFDALLEFFETAEGQLRGEILQLFCFFPGTKELVRILDKALNSHVDLERFCAALTSMHISIDSLREASLLVLEQALVGDINVDSYAELRMAEGAPIVLHQAYREFLTG